MSDGRRGGGGLLEIQNTVCFLKYSRKCDEGS